MENHNSKPARDLTLIALVAALYVTVTLLVSPIAYGQVQFRISEAFNHLAIFNKRYIWALSLGVFIANMWSTLGMIDMIVGTFGTLCMTAMSYYATRHIKNIKIKLLISTLIDTAMMWVVALELYVVSKIPFWITFGWVALGEFIALVIGAIMIYILNTRIDLEK